jgi:5'-nucleotidase
VADATVQTQVVDPVAAAVEALAQNVIATTEVGLDGVRGNVRSRETNLGNLVADALLWQADQLNEDFGAAEPDVAFQNGGGIRNDDVREPGDFTELDSFDILPFGNFVAIVEDVPAAQFKEIVENAVSRVDGTSGTGRFAQIAGFSFVYDVSGTAQQLDGDGNVTTPGDRVVSITLDDGTEIVEGGAVVAGAPDLNIAIADFLARGGDQYPFRGADFTSLGVTYQQALANYVTDELGGTISEEDYPEGGEGRILQTSDVAVTLTILHHNDGESSLLGTGPEDAFGGAARFATLADSLRTLGEMGGKADALLVSAGDNFLPGPEFDASLENGVPYYDALLYDYLGYDAITLGNHDFDLGPDVLADFITSFEGDTPFLSANLDFSNEAVLQALVTSGALSGSTTVEQDGERYGIVGATTPNLTFISSPRDVIVEQAVAPAVQAEIDALLASGVDKIIVVSHLQGVQEDSTLATQLRGVDVMVAGGGDELLASESALLIPGDERAGAYPLMSEDADGNPVPVVTTQGNYGYIGRLVVEFDAAGDLIRVVDELSDPVRVSSDGDDAVEPDAFIQSAVVDPVAAAVADLASNVIATSAVDLDARRNSVRFVETNLGNLVADAMLWQARELAGDFGVDAPDVALQNGGGIRSDAVYEAGPFTELDSYDILPFGNFVSVIEDVPAAQFKEILENAVSRVTGTSGTGRFAQIAGFSFVYTDERQAQEIGDDGTVTTAGERIREVRLDNGTVLVENGAVVDASATVDIVTADFLLRGGDQYPFRDAPFTALGVTYQRALANYVEVELGGQITAEMYPVGGEGRIIEADPSSTDGAGELPTVLTLDQSYPNPTATSATIRFGLPEASEQLRLTLHDMLGREVAVIVSGSKAAGYHDATLDASSLASGVYVYRLATEGGVRTGRVTVVR